MKKYLTLQDVYLVADGLKLRLEKTKDTNIQEMFYNEWTYNHYVANIFVPVPNKCVIYWAIHAPESMPNSSIGDSGNMYNKLQHIYIKTSGQVVATSAFAKGKYPFLIKSLQDEQEAYVISKFIQCRQATVLWQTAQWEMAAFQGIFIQMKDRFRYKKEAKEKSSCGAQSCSFIYVPNLSRSIKLYPSSCQRSVLRLTSFCNTH